MATSTRQDPSERRAARRRAFADEFGRVLDVRGVTQRGLADMLGVKSQGAISAWKTGEATPDPDLVFDCERVLELPPGHLSSLLGYLPPDAVDARAATFEDVVVADPLLDEGAKRGLLAMYRELTARKKRR